MLKQISISMENKKGYVQGITQILADNQINILGSTTAGSAEFGVIRLIVSEPERALDIFRKSGLFCQETRVLGIEILDEVGAMNKLLLAVADSNINVDYTYLSFNRETGRPIMIMHTEDLMEVESCLRRKGFVSLAKI